jgi:hypothetical protein
MTGFVNRERAAGLTHAGRRVRIALLASIALGAAVAGCMGAGATAPIIYLTYPPTAAPPATATPTATASPTPTPTPTPVPTPTPTPPPGPTPTPGPCNSSKLAVTIQSSGGLYWQGGGGHAMATFQMKNTGTVACTIKAKNQAVLLNGDDSILIHGPAAGTSATLKLAPGGSVHTMVQTGNLCDAPAIVPPVRVAFEIPGTGEVVATPLSPTDEGGVPSCMGDPSVYSGSIDMQPWTP